MTNSMGGIGLEYDNKYEHGENREPILASRGSPKKIY